MMKYDLSKTNRIGELNLNEMPWFKEGWVGFIDIDAAFYAKGAMINITVVYGGHPWDCLFLSYVKNSSGYEPSEIVYIDCAKFLDNIFDDLGGDVFEKVRDAICYVNRYMLRCQLEPNIMCSLPKKLEGVIKNS